MNRPRHLIAIVGTHTEVGKTWLACDLLRRWHAQGLRVAARKPVQSYDPAAGETDADRLASATGEHRHNVCPEHRSYPQAMAPPMAANVLGRPRILLQEVLAETVWPESLDVAVVETVGGVRSPLAHDGDSIDLVRGLQPDQIVLVADAGLGTLNAVKLTLGHLQNWPTKVFLNRYEPANCLHRLNLEWLVTRDNVIAVTSSEALARELLSADCMEDGARAAARPSG
jgi:dethiobiotin synthetase